MWECHRKEVLKAGKETSRGMNLGLEPEGSFDSFALRKRKQDFAQDDIVKGGDDGPSLPAGHEHQHQTARMRGTAKGTKPCLRQILRAMNQATEA